MSPPRRKERQGRIKSCTSGWWTHTFSAFWLRSSVVSVLTSLISGTGTTGPYQDYPNLLNHRAGSRGLPRPVRKWPRHCTARQASLVPSGINLQSNECTLCLDLYIFFFSISVRLILILFVGVCFRRECPIIGWWLPTQCCATTAVF